MNINKILQEKIKIIKIQQWINWKIFKEKNKAKYLD